MSKLTCVADRSYALCYFTDRVKATRTYRVRFRTPTLVAILFGRPADEPLPRAL